VGEVETCTKLLSQEVHPEYDERPEIFLFDLRTGDLLVADTFVLGKGFLHKVSVKYRNTKTNFTKFIVEPLVRVASLF